MSQDICSTIIRTKTIWIHVFVERSRLPGNTLSRESLKRKRRECEEEYNETPLWRSKPSNERESNNERFSGMTNAIWYRTSREREDKDIDWRVRVTGKVASLIHSTIPSSPRSFFPNPVFILHEHCWRKASSVLFSLELSRYPCDATVIVRFVSMESVLNLSAYLSFERRRSISRYIWIKSKRFTFGWLHKEINRIRVECIFRSWFRNRAEKSREGDDKWKWKWNSFGWFQE